MGMEISIRQAFIQGMQEAKGGVQTTSSSRTAAAANVGGKESQVQDLKGMTAFARLTGSIAGKLLAKLSGDSSPEKLETVTASSQQPKPSIQEQRKELREKYDMLPHSVKEQHKWVADFLISGAKAGDELQVPKALFYVTQLLESQK